MPAAAFDNISFGQFFVAVLLAAGLSMWVYWHASKHGSKHATAWGVLTFLAVGLFLPLYFINYYLTRRRF
jgi:hypothetical protein